LTSKRYSKIFPKTQSIRGFFGNKCSRQNWAWKLSSTSGLSQIWKIRNVWKLPSGCLKDNSVKFFDEYLKNLTCWEKTNKYGFVISSWKSMKKSWVYIACGKKMTCFSLGWLIHAWIFPTSLKIFGLKIFFWFTVYRFYKRFYGIMVISNRNSCKDFLFNFK
jgi:hypothetical protein